MESTQYSRDMSVRTLTIAASSGLYRVHLLQLSTGQSHDEAAKPGILSHSTEGFDYSFAIQVCGDRLSVLFIGHTMESENDLLVWNWKSGKTETVRLRRHLFLATLLMDSDSICMAEVSHHSRF